MTELRIRFHPDPILKIKCTPITEYNEELYALLDSMKVVMEKLSGLGLAANQVGVSKAIFLLKDKHGTVHEFINPKILSVDGTETLSEGCLSAPGIYLNIARPQSVVVEFQDRHGEIKRIIAEGIEARVCIHEIEHLNGDFYFNRLNRKNRKIAESALRRNLK